MKRHCLVMRNTYHYDRLEEILVIRVEVVINVNQVVVMMMITTDKMKAREGLTTLR